MLSSNGELLFVQLEGSLLSLSLCVCVCVCVCASVRVSLYIYLSVCEYVPCGGADKHPRPLQKAAEPVSHEPSQASSKHLPLDLAPSRWYPS